VFQDVTTSSSVNRSDSNTLAIGCNEEITDVAALSVHAKYEGLYQNAALYQKKKLKSFVK
jgi:hypothetical protein